MAGFRYYSHYLAQGLSYSDSAAANGGGTASAVGTLGIAGSAAASGVGNAAASGTLSISSSVSFSGNGFADASGNLILIYSPLTVTFSLAQSEISVEFT